MSENSIIIGIDLGASKILMIIVTTQNKVLHRVKLPTKTAKGQSAVLDQIVSHAAQLMADFSRQGWNPIAVGVGFPGLVQFESGITYSSIMLPGWETINLKQYLHHKLGIPVTVDNDVNAATYGEWKYGAGAGYKDVICLTVGTGIGGGIILNNSLFRGVDGTAGEFGNITVAYHESDALVGNSGTLNTLASGKALETRALELINHNKPDPILLSELHNNVNTLNVEQLARAAAAGSPIAKRVIEDGAMYLGLGIANFINIFNPQVVVIGGGVIQIGDWYFEKVRQTVYQRAFDVPAKRAKILPVSLGQDAGAVGAAALAFSSI